MKTITKDLTTLNTFGSKTVKKIEQLNNGEVDFLCTVDTNVRSNRFDKHFVGQIFPTVNVIGQSYLWVLLYYKCVLN